MGKLSLRGDDYGWYFANQPAKRSAYGSPHWEFYRGRGCFRSDVLDDKRGARMVELWYIGKPFRWGYGLPSNGKRFVSQFCDQWGQILHKGYKRATLARFGLLGEIPRSERISTV